MRNVEIGERIQSRRKELDISVIEIAARTGLSKATIHRYESGEIKNIKLPTIEIIAEILKVNPSWLLGKSEVKEQEIDYSSDLVVMLDSVRDYLNHKALLTANGRRITEQERMMVISALSVARNIIDKG